METFHPSDQVVGSGLLNGGEDELCENGLQPDGSHGAVPWARKMISLPYMSYQILPVNTHPTLPTQVPGAGLHTCMPGRCL